MTIPTLALNTNVLVTGLGAQWLVPPQIPGTTQYAYFFSVADTQQYASQASLWRRLSTGGWNRVGAIEIFSSTQPITIVVAPFSQNWVSYAVIPFGLGRNGRLINMQVSQF